MKNIQIIDNCVTLQYQNFLVQELHAPNLVWVFANDVTHTNKNKGNPGFSNIAYQNNTVNSTAYWFLYPVLLEACSKANINVEQLIRIRLGIYLNRNTTQPNSPHVDQNEPHMVGLYYLEDFDGDTVFYTDSTGQTELTRVTPKKGRMVIFDGGIYHASSNPVSSEYRTTINFNFISSQK